MRSTLSILPLLVIFLLPVAINGQTTCVTTATGGPYGDETPVILCTATPTPVTATCVPVTVTVTPAVAVCSSSSSGGGGYPNVPPSTPPPLSETKSVITGSSSTIPPGCSTSTPITIISEPKVCQKDTFIGIIIGCILCGMLFMGLLCCIPLSVLWRRTKREECDANEKPIQNGDNCE